VVPSQLLVTKYLTPIVSQPLVERPRLDRLLESGLQRKLTLVSAPAGFGKSTLIASWVKTQLETHASDTTSDEAKSPLIAWVSLEASDNSAVLFWNYIFTAVENDFPGCTTEALNALQAPEQISLEHVLTLFINARMQHSNPNILILDDFHLITDGVIHRSLAFLLEHMPVQMHVMLLSRSEPPLPLARLRARRQVNEIGVEALRCTRAETASFLQDVMGVAVDDEAVTQLTVRTEGWLVGLQLLGLSLQGRRDPNAVLEELRGSQRYVLDYLMDEVLRQQPDAVQVFLLRTSILDRLNASLCDALLERDDGQVMLELLERANLFVIALDNHREWFRYHNLFREALQVRLGVLDLGVTRGLHLRASDWFAEQGDSFLAVSHAIQAEAWPRAVNLLAAMPYTDLLRPAEIPTLLRWFDQIPGDLIYRRFHLCQIYISFLSYSGQHAVADTWLQALSEYLSEHTDIPEAEHQTLSGYVAAARAQIAALFGDATRARAFARVAASLLPEQSVLERSAVMTAESTAALSDGEIVKAYQSVLPAIALMRQAGQLIIALAQTSVAAMYLQMQGRPRDAWTLLEQTLTQVVKPGDPPVAMASFLYIFQSFVLLERNELDAALELALQGIYLGEQAGFIACVEQGHNFLMPIHLARGEYVQAQAALDRVVQMPLHQNSIFEHALWITPVQVKLWLACGELRRAQDWADQLETSERPSAALARERQDVALVRVLLASDQPERALLVLQRIVPGAIRNERWDHVLEMWLLEVVAQHLNKNQSAALEVLERAVLLGEPQRYVRRFLDEGPVMASLLSTLLSKKREQESGSKFLAYLETLLSAFQANESPDMVLTAHPKTALVSALLSGRETDVLGLLARGLSNDEIARKLQVSKHTVKSHVVNVLSKLEASNRTHAVAQARVLGLIEGDA
jgi:LuxR family transcriptional regulator, maltose regulon positive regulatory protein